MFRLRISNTGLKNGLRIKANLRNVNLDNRNLSFGLEKTGVFGADIRTNRFRRIYDFDGANYTERDLTSGGIWFYPNRYLKVFAKGSLNSVAGQISDLFDPGDNVIAREVDYDRSKYGVGARFKYKGGMFHAEYSTLTYEDNNDELKDQSRNRIRLIGYLPVPGYEWVVLSGVFQKFESKYDATDFKINSTTAKGSIAANFTPELNLNYVTFFNRAGSDSAFVDTDNVAHLIYASYDKPELFGFTFGYQNDVNDDFEDVVKANSYYFSGWFTPYPNYEFRLEHGLRNEEVEEGFRLTGNDERNRLKIYGKYKLSEKGSIKIGFESKERENEQLESQAEFSKYFAEAGCSGSDYFVFYGGYSYSKGDYENTVSTFEFSSQQVYLNLNSNEYNNLTGGFGLTYFRNKLDLDSEGINLLFTEPTISGKTIKLRLFTGCLILMISLL